jgi:exonuclease VII small subunit
MSTPTNSWTLLVYRIPTQPSRLRLLIWRKLHAMGALNVQNAAWLLPSRPDLDENMQYIVAQIEEMGGSCYLFSAAALMTGSVERLTEEFRTQADSHLEEIIERLEMVSVALDSAASPSALERAEGDLKRERVAYLRARRLAYFGNTKEAEVDARLDALKRSLDDLYRGGK